MKLPTHRNEHTGNPGADRVQDNVRALIASVNGLLLSLARTHGVAMKRVQMKDEAYTLTASDLEGAFIAIDGPLTAGRDVVVPRATDREAYGRWFDNLTGQTLTFVNQDGSDSVTAVTGTIFLVVSSDGPVGWK